MAARRRGLGLLCAALLVLGTGSGCVKLVETVENASPGTFEDMEDVCAALRAVAPFASLIGDAKPLPGGDGGNCEWSPTETPGKVALKVETVLHQGPVIENTNTHVKNLVDANTCDESCPPTFGVRGLLDISVSHDNAGGLTDGWMGCGQAVDPHAVRFFGFIWYDNIVLSLTMQTRWQVPADQLPGLVTDPAGPLRMAFQTAYLTFTYNENLPDPAPLAPPAEQSRCDR
jgi:hypothetical protein